MTSFALHGLGVSGGIAIGRAQLVSHATLEVAHYTIPSGRVEGEIARLDHALNEVRAELEGLHDAMTAGDAPAEFGAFLDVHAMILTDPTLSETPKRIIAEQHCNAEWALTQQMNVLVDQFEEIEDAYLRERKADVVQVVERVLKRLLGKPGALVPVGAEQHTILVAHDLSPADVIQFKTHRYAGFITDLGGVTSHTAIVARSLAVPAVAGTHNGRALIRENELLILDGTNHVVIVNPRQVGAGRVPVEAERARARARQAAPAQDEAGDDARRTHDRAPGEHRVAGRSRAGARQRRHGHRSLPLGVPVPEPRGAAVGGRAVRGVSRVAAGMGGKPVTIRTFDLGADKHKEGLDGLVRVAPNPALGLRAVRFCLAEPRLFQTQLRAILRASHYGKREDPGADARRRCGEIDQTLAMIAQAKETLREQGVPFDAGVEVGGMIEIPAAVLAISAFLAKLDFLSIGTNDLIQYTLAVDRSDDAVAHLYDPLHPAVLKLIGMAIASADKAAVPIAVCGEMAGDPHLTRLLLGLGLRNLSMHPAQLLNIKQRVLTSDVGALDAAGRAHAQDRRSRRNSSAQLDKLNA